MTGMHPPTQRYRRCFLQIAGSLGLLAAPSQFAAFTAEGGAAGYLPSLLPRARTAPIWAGYAITSIAEYVFYDHNARQKTIPLPIPCYSLLAGSAKSYQRFGIAQLFRFGRRLCI